MIKQNATEKIEKRGKKTCSNIEPSRTFLKIKQKRSDIFLIPQLRLSQYQSPTVAFLLTWCWGNVSGPGCSATTVMLSECEWTGYFLRLNTVFKELRPRLKINNAQGERFSEQKIFRQVLMVLVSNTVNTAVLNAI